MLPPPVKQGAGVSEGDRDKVGTEALTLTSSVKLTQAFNGFLK